MAVKERDQYGPVLDAAAASKKSSALSSAIAPPLALTASSPSAPLALTGPSASAAASSSSTSQPSTSDGSVHTSSDKVLLCLSDTVALRDAILKSCVGRSLQSVERAFICARRAAQCAPLSGFGFDIVVGSSSSVSVTAAA